MIEKQQIAIQEVLALVGQKELELVLLRRQVESLQQMMDQMAKDRDVKAQVSK